MDRRPYRCDVPGTVAGRHGGDRILLPLRRRDRRCPPDEGLTLHFPRPTPVSLPIPRRRPTAMVGAVFPALPVRRILPLHTFPAGTSTASSPENHYYWLSKPKLRLNAACPD